MKEADMDLERALVFCILAVLLVYVVTRLV